MGSSSVPEGSDATAAQVFLFLFVFVFSYFHYLTHSSTENNRKYTPPLSHSLSCNPVWATLDELCARAPSFRPRLSLGNSSSHAISIPVIFRTSSQGPKTGSNRFGATLFQGIPLQPYPGIIYLEHNFATCCCHVCVFYSSCCSSFAFYHKWILLFSRPRAHETVSCSLGGGEGRQYK